jgi:hypothetical protein
MKEKWGLYMPTWICFTRISSIQFSRWTHPICVTGWLYLSATNPRLTLSLPYELLDEGAAPKKQIKIFWTQLKTFVRLSDFEKPLPLYSWRSLIHQSHVECTSLSRFKSQYTCSLSLDKWAIRCGSIFEVQLSIKHIINIPHKCSHTTGWTISPFIF